MNQLRSRKARLDIHKSAGMDPRTAELLDALADEWGASHAEALRRCVWVAAARMARTSPRIRRQIEGS